MELGPKTQQIHDLAIQLANDWPRFHEILGPGRDFGDGSTRSYIQKLRTLAKTALKKDYAEAKIVDGTNYAVDYYIEGESTIVEIAMGLRNPSSEFERDTFKALLAKASGKKVEKLLFLCKPGGSLRCSTPGVEAIKEWVSKKGIEIEVIDFPNTADAILEYPSE